MSARTIHPFPARMAPDIALHAIPHQSAGSALTVLDPMCGSGTVLAAALQLGHNAVGVDIDPLAVMMSTLTVTKIDGCAMAARAEDVATVAEKAEGTAPWSDDAETDEFVNYWFAPKQRRQLVDLTTAIAGLDDPDVQLALRLAISRIIVTKSSQASLAADTAHSRPHRVRTDSDYDVLEGFRRSARQLSRMLAQRELKGTGQVELGDARELTTVADGSADLAVTSPPYLNALDYLRGHKLALVWFGHTIADLRVRRGSSIGAERGLGRAASDAVMGIVDIIESEAIDKSVLKRPMLERFAEDCCGFATQLHRKVKPEGHVVLVIGNSTLRGNYIRNDVIAQRAMEQAGFRYHTSVEREIPPSSRYMAINASDMASSVTKRMRKEIVLTMVR